MKRVIHVTVRDKIATAPKEALYVCGNSDYSIQFDFDEEWLEYTHKTARFNCGHEPIDVVFSGNICPVPKISNVTHFYVGAYAGDLRTTTPAYVSAKKSILCGSGSPKPPTPDVYAQIMEILNTLKVEIPPEQIDAAVYKWLEENQIDGINEEELKKAVEAALEEANESGKFKGDQGEPGPAGADGKDGSDYVLTDADKQEIAEMVNVNVDGGASIDDTTPSANTTYSSSKIDALLNEQKEAIVV